MERAAVLGDRMLNRFKKALAGDNHVVDMRGRGLMLGIELDSPQPHLVKAALATGLLINVTHERVIRLLPPLILSDETGRRNRRPHRCVDQANRYRVRRDPTLPRRCSTSALRNSRGSSSAAIEHKRMREAGTIYEPLRGPHARDGVRPAVDADARRVRSGHAATRRTRDIPEPRPTPNWGVANRSKTPRAYCPKWST